MRLTTEQMKQRSGLKEDFRKAIAAAMWQVIESAPPELLCSDDGTPYGETFQCGVSSLEQMVNEAARDACKHMENWL